MFISSIEMELPKIVNVKVKYLRARGYDNFSAWNTPDHLYIGRNMNFYVPGTLQSKWHNPYAVKKYGLAECLKLYEAHIRNTPELFNSLPELINYKELGCWCVEDPSKTVCHGQVLVKLLKETL
jgi:hypothetical protein